MSIRTPEDLSDQLSNDLAWRKKELAQIKSLVKSQDIPPSRHKVFVRSAICLLYSHWEGFVKFAANAYLNYVRIRKLKYGELSHNFLAFAMKDKLQAVNETNKASVYIPVCNFFISELSQRAKLPKDGISTSSNLSSAVLREIILTLGLDFIPYSSKDKLIDEKLLQSRNKIAHGEYLSIDGDYYMELQAQVVDMLDLFRNQIENAAILEQYQLPSLTNTKS
ncbi:MAG: MAE_28990/MAE_18760 family HEPN-like nuclease [Phormidium sp.]